MKKLIFTLLLLFFTFYLFSQVNKLYDFGTNTICPDIAKLPNGNYIFATEANYDTTRLTIINENGEIQEQIKLNYYDALSYNTIEVFNNNIYTFIKVFDNSVDTTKYFLSFTCYDLNFDTIWNKKYFVDTTLIYARDFIKTNDGGYALVGSIDKGGYKYDALLIKTDSLGEIQWYKEYGYTNSDGFTDIVQTEDKGYIISGYSKKYSTSDWYIVHTDSLGNQIWDWVLHNPLNLNDGEVADLIQTGDGNFVAVGGQTYFSDYYTLQNARFLKFDINKNVIIDTLFYEDFEYSKKPEKTYSVFHKIKEKDNGNFILISSKQGTPDNTPATHPLPVLYELDKNLNIIKRREYKPIIGRLQAYYIKDIILKPEGGIIGIGDVNTYGALNPSQQVWFLNTDSNYCDGFGSCDTIFSMDMSNTDSLSKKTPNTLKFKINSFDNINYNIILRYWYSGTGFGILCTDTVYNIQANQEHDFSLSYDWLLENSYFTPIGDTIYVQYDLTPVDSNLHRDMFSFIRDNFLVFIDPDGIEEINKQETSLVIYPNPATNNVQITMNNLQLGKNTSVFVYDVYGKIIRVIASEAWQSVQTDSHEQSSRYDVITIDISSLEKGIYFVRVGGAVGKFVKE